MMASGSNVLRMKEPGAMQFRFTLNGSDSLNAEHLTHIDVNRS